MDVDRISDELKGVKLGKDFSLFLVCLFLACLFWLLNAFTKTYSTTIEIPIEYSNIPDDKLLSNTLPEKAIAEIEGTGFRLLSVSFISTPNPIQIDFTKGHQRLSRKKLVSSFGPDEIRSQVLDEIPSEISLGKFSIDSVKVIVEDASFKTVRLRPILVYELDYPFFLSGPITVSPKAIEISGANSVIQGLDTIYTEELELGEVEETVSKTLQLDFPNGIKSEISEATIEIPIDEYTEGTVEIPVVVINLKKGEELILFPPKVKVTYLVGLSQYDNVLKEDFEFVVDASAVIKGKASLIVKQIATSSLVDVQDFEPHKIEFIIKK